MPKKINTKKNNTPKQVEEDVFEDNLHFINDDFIDFLTCVICQNVYNRPSRISCGHTFCEACIDSWLKSPQNINCPMCRKKVLKQQTGKDLIAEKVINSLSVKCINKGNLFILSSY